MPLLDNFDAGAPGTPLVGPYFVSEVVYTASGRDGSVGIADGGTPDGSAAYFQYEPGPEMPTATVSIDYLVTAGTGLPPSGSVQGAQLLNCYGTSPVDGPYSDLFSLSLVITSGGIGLAFDNSITGSFGQYVIEGSGGGSTSTDYANHTEQPTGVWRTARASLASGTLTVDVLDTSGATVWSSGPIAAADWTLTGCYVGLGHEATYGHAVNGDNFFFDAPVPDTAVVLRGVEGDMPLADVHHGAFAVPDGTHPRISFQTQLDCAIKCWVHVMIQWYGWDGAVLNEISLDRGVISDFGGGTLGDFTQVDMRVTAREGATHWRPKYLFSSTDPLDAVTPIPAGTEVAIECIYIPDNGKSVATREFLDGDQSYGIWEGDDRQSSSVYGVKVPPSIPVYVGATEVNARYTTALTSIAYPASVQEGDLVVLGMIGGFSPGRANCPDPRMTQVHYATIGGRQSGVWVGYASDLATPLQIDLLANFSATGQFSAAGLAAFRSTIDSPPLQWDPARVAYSSVNGESSSTGVGTPGLPGYGSGAIGLLQASAGIGGAYGPSLKWQNGTVKDFADSARLDNDAYVVNYFGVATKRKIVTQGVLETDPGDVWRAVVIGLK